MSGSGAQRQYQGEAGRAYHGQKRGIPQQAEPWVARHRAIKIAPHLDEKDVLFEYGVGSGWNLAALKCARKIGCDVSDFLAPVVRGHGIEFLADARELPAGSVDVALCHHTLEHVESPLAVLQELHRVLRPEGRLLLFVPFENERRYQQHDPCEPNHHLYSWNVQTLGNLVTAAGFDLRRIEVAVFRFDRFAARWAVRLRLGERGYRIIRLLANLLDPGHEIRLVSVKRA